MRPSASLPLRLVSNERLRGALEAAGLSLATFAEKVGVDKKTAERWITRGRVPHRGHRHTVVELFGVDETYLWPVLDDDPRTRSASRAELVEFYPSRSAVPADMWSVLTDGAVECVDILAYAAFGVVEQANLVDRLVGRGEAGVRVRVLIGDPTGSAVAKRAHEEGMGTTVKARVSLTLGYFRDAANAPGVDVRLHDTCLYASIFRFDNDVLVNTHAFGAPAAASPVLHLRRVPGGRVFDHYMRSFERAWETGTRLGNTYKVLDN